LETLFQLLKMTYILGYLGIAVWWWTTFVGMHNNTIDGYSFRLTAYPLPLFYSEHFTEDGNKYRLSHFRALATSVIWSTPFYFSYLRDCSEQCSM